MKFLNEMTRKTKNFQLKIYFQDSRSRKGFVKHFDMMIKVKKQR